MALARGKAIEVYTEMAATRERNPADYRDIIMGFRGSPRPLSEAGKQIKESHSNETKYESSRCWQYSSLPSALRDRVQPALPRRTTSMRIPARMSTANSEKIRIWFHSSDSP